jgi:DNA-binding NtrC family response regulator
MNPRGAILVIEDDSDVRRSARVALMPHVERVELVESPDRLEDLLIPSTFDVLLLDMNFVTGERSGQSGLNALSRAHAVDSTLAVVLMTAYGGVSLAVDALKQGGTDFILKPWRNDKFIAAVTAAVQVTQSRRLAETLQLDALERNAIERALARHDGNISAVATALGLSRGALYRRITKHGL